MSRDTTVIAFRQPEAIDDPLSELAREGARRMLAQVLIAEADSFVARWKVRIPTKSPGYNGIMAPGIPE
jgi:putative transposase